MAIIRRVFDKLRWTVRAAAIRADIGRRQSWAKLGVASAEHYWSRRNDESNRLLHRKLAVVDYTSVLEIGTNCGNRLYLLAKEHPNVRFVGIDLNRAAVEYGNSRFSEEGITNVELFESDSRELAKLQQERFDVVFSWASLMYVHPKYIKDVISSALTLSRKASVFIELHDKRLTAPREIVGHLSPPANWRRNFELLLDNLGVPPDKRSIDPVPTSIWDPGGGPGSVVTVRRE